MLHYGIFMNLFINHYYKELIKEPRHKEWGGD